jgi:hypothetical protein
VRKLLTQWNSYKPHPEQAVGYEKPKAAGALPPENDNLMSQGEVLKLQRCAVANVEREQGNESGQNRDDAPRRHDGGAGKSSIILDGS